MSSFEVDINYTGLNLNVLADKFTPEITEKLIDRLATLGVFTMYTEAPFRTGLTANTIRKEVSGLTALVGPTTSYAPFIEYGTAPHIITAKQGGVLAFEAGGEMVFTPIVHHPGTRPNPFVHRTAEIIEEQTQDVFDELWSETIK